MQRFYFTKKVLFTIKQILINDEIDFAIAILVIDSKVFIMHIATLEKKIYTSYYKSLNQY